MKEEGDIMVNALKKEPLIISTEAEFNVDDTIKAEIEKAVQGAVNECSKKYFRTIEVKVFVSTK